MKGFIAFLLVLIVAGLGYVIYDREAQKKGGSLNLFSNEPPKPEMSPVLVSQFRDLFKTGNQFSQAVKTGLNLSTFNEYSVTLRAQISSIEKLWPDGYQPETQTLLNKLEGSLLVTAEAWQTDHEQQRRSDGDSSKVTGSSHGLLLLKTMGLVNGNPYGLSMTFGGEGGVITSGDLLGEDTSILKAINSDKRYWLVSYKDVEGGKHSDIPMLISLCDGFYGSLEEKILPLIK